jgi:hypothetical protein
MKQPGVMKFSVTLADTKKAGSCLRVANATYRDRLLARVDDLQGNLLSGIEAGLIHRGICSDRSGRARKDIAHKIGHRENGTMGITVVVLQM